MTQARTRLTIDRQSMLDLKHLYEIEGLSIASISKRTGHSRSSVHRWLHEIGFEARSLSESTKMGLIRKPRPRGPNHRNYRHGRTAEGYAVCNTHGRRELAHRVAAACFLGRALTRIEVVHHCNDDKADNRPENLWVFPSQSDHAKYHKTGIIHPDTIFIKDHLK